MGIGRRVADKKGDHFSELPEETNTNSKSKKNRRRQKKTSPVQKLFKTCKEVFASGGTGIVPPPQDIEKLRSVLGMYLKLFILIIISNTLFTITA